tara:strand:- start:3022 stop:3738 length:717 start_codon:yes stop_codon:yes gene_type:complete
MSTIPPSNWSSLPTPQPTSPPPRYDVGEFLFTEKWFALKGEVGENQSHEERWTYFFNQYKKQTGNIIQDVLEIGCYEGRSSIWIAQNLLQEGGTLDVIDTFTCAGDAGMAQCRELVEKDPDYLLKTFKHNTSQIDNVVFTPMRGLSQDILPTLGREAKYDFIYIDGSHDADDTFIDSYYCHPLLRSGGVLIFDDYLWKDPGKTLSRECPKAGIDFFYHMYGDLYDVAYQEYQFVLIKK